MMNSYSVMRCVPFDRLVTYNALSSRRFPAFTVVFASTADCRGAGLYAAVAVAAAGEDAAGLSLRVGSKSRAAMASATLR